MIALYKDHTEDSPVSFNKTPENDSPTVDKSAPWLRYFARMFDYYCVILMLQLLFLLAPSLLALWAFWGMWVSIYVVVFIFVEAYLISSWGYTFGKYIYGIKVRSNDGSKLKFIQSLKRSFEAGFFGMGLGNPFLLIPLNVLGFYRLIKKQTTYWDTHAETTIAYEQVGPIRVAIGIILGVLIGLLNMLIVIGGTVFLFYGLKV